MKNVPKEHCLGNPDSEGIEKLCPLYDNVVHLIFFPLHSGDIYHAKSMGQT